MKTLQLKDGSLVTLENGKAVIRKDGIWAEGIDPDKMMDDLDQFEDQLSEQLDEEIFFDIQNREEESNWVQLRHAMLHGDIIHVIETGEEFLAYRKLYVYLGRGKASNWEGFEKQEGSYPDSSGGMSEGLIYSQPHRETDSPLDMYNNWEDDFEVTASMIRARNTY